MDCSGGECRVAVQNAVFMTPKSHYQQPLAGQIRFALPGLNWSAAILACFCALPVSASAMTELMLQLDSSLHYDSNPLHIPQDTPIQPILNSDKQRATVLSNDVRGALVFPLDSPKTRLILTGQLGRRNYDAPYTGLDDTEFDYKAALQWQAGSAWRGELSHERQQQLFGYYDGSITARTMVRLNTDSAEVALRMTPDLELPLTLKRRSSVYDNTAETGFNDVENSQDLGLRFLTTTQSRFRVGVMATEVNFPDRSAADIAVLDSRYVDEQLYLDTDWQYSTKTRISGRVAALWRHYETLQSKNFTALNLEMRAVQDYSPKTRLSAELWSRPMGLTDATILYIISTGAQLSARWQISPKSRVTLFALDERQNYYYALQAVGQTNPVYNRVRAGASYVYALSRDLRLYADGYAEHQNRANVGPPIDQFYLRTGIEYTLENSDGLAQRVGFGERR